GAPIPTSSTARHLCSATLNSHSMSGSVKHQAGQHIAATRLVAILVAIFAWVQAAGENFPYVFKGARSAPGPGWPPPLGQRRAQDDADPDAAQLPPVTAQACQGNVARLGAASRT